MNHNWGECYFDHYASFLNTLTNRRVYESGHDTPSIQVLEYSGVFVGCRVFASLGLSHYSSSLGQICEVVVPADAGWASIPTILANTLFHVVKHHRSIGSGIGINGIDIICPEFTRAYTKHALYFTHPYGYPNGFETLKCSNELGHVYLGIFISQSEFDYLSKVGADRFEELLQNRGVDPYNVGRTSVI